MDDLASDRRCAKAKERGKEQYDSNASHAGSIRPSGFDPRRDLGNLLSCPQSFHAYISEVERMPYLFTDGELEPERVKIAELKDILIRLHWSTRLPF